MSLFENTNFKLQKFVSGSLSNNSYLISNKTTGESLIIDVPDSPRELINKIPRDRFDKSKNQEKIKALITHGHYDHIEGIELLTERVGMINIHIGLEDSKYLNYEGNIVRLRSQKVLEIKNLAINLIYTPGHTEGSVCYYLDFGEKRFLFSGDTLFPGGPGKTTDSKNFRKIYSSISNDLYSLPKDTIILPGHGKSITINESISEFESFKFNNHIFGDINWKN